MITSHYYVKPAHFAGNVQIRRVQYCDDIAETCMCQWHLATIGLDGIDGFDIEWSPEVTKWLAANAVAAANSLDAARDAVKMNHRKIYGGVTDGEHNWHMQHMEK